MRNKIIIFAAAVASVCAGLVIANGIAPDSLHTLYSDFANRVADSHDRNRELIKRRQSAVPSANAVIRVVGPLVGQCPGAVVVGLIDRKRELILGWGKDASGHDANGDTVFETASVSKAFAGLLLAQLAQDGTVKLEEPVQDLTAVPVPVRGKPMTLRELATHSSGLPPWPDNRGDTRQPYSHWKLLAYLPQAQLLAEPDTGIMYSNTAFALLGDLLAERKGMTFNELLQKRICAPLGMKRTQVGLPRPLRGDLAVGHWADGREAEPSAPTAGGGADGIRSTVRDLLHFLSAYIGVQPTNFQPALDMSVKRYISFDEKLDSGLGWFYDTTDDTIEKSGHIAGYRTTIMYDPASKCAVCILAGWEAFPAPELAKKLLYLMTERRQLIESGGILND